MGSSSKQTTYNRREVAQILSNELGRDINIDKIKNLEKSQLVKQAHEREKGGRYDAMKYTRADIDELALYFDLKESGLTLNDLKQYRDFNSDEQRYELLLEKFVEKQIDQLKTTYSLKRINGYLYDFEQELDIDEKDIHNYTFEALEFTTAISMHAWTHTTSTNYLYLEVEQLANKLLKKLNDKVEKETGKKNYYDDYKLIFYSTNLVNKTVGNADIKYETELVLDIVEKIDNVKWNSDIDTNKESFEQSKVESVSDLIKGRIEDLFFNEDYTFQYIELSTLFDMVDAHFKKNSFLSNIKKAVNPYYGVVDYDDPFFKGRYVYTYLSKSLEDYMSQDVLSYYRSLENSGKFELKPLRFITVALADIGYKDNMTSAKTKFSINTWKEVLLIETKFRLHYAITKEVSYDDMSVNSQGVRLMNDAILDKFNLEQATTMVYEFHKYAGESSVNIRSFKLWIPIQERKK